MVSVDEGSLRSRTAYLMCHLLYSAGTNIQTNEEVGIKLVCRCDIKLVV